MTQGLRLFLGGSSNAFSTKVTGIWIVNTIIGKYTGHFGREMIAPVNLQPDLPNHSLQTMTAYICINICFFIDACSVSSGRWHFGFLQRASTSMCSKPRLISDYCTFSHLCDLQVVTAFTSSTALDTENGTHLADFRLLMFILDIFA